MHTIIDIHGLGKKYQIGRALPYRMLRESLAAMWKARAHRHMPKRTETIWALKDVNLRVGAGDVVGIIGRNGSGKSTLLKILARITRPTIGEVRLNGRVGSLLEVATGFHPELTGRENIYLNGAILGMRARDIATRFDEIVSFAGVEKFIDTPVKHYSSGMYLRLAFSVASHLDTEILLMDEVLAVGDMSFQRKCLSKMEEVGRSGRTVLFVSHNTSAVARLCPRTILLQDGAVVADGPSNEIVSGYLRADVGATAVREWSDLEGAPGNDVVRLAAVRVRDELGRIAQSVDIRRAVGIEIEFLVLRPGHLMVPNVEVFNQQGVCAFVSVDTGPQWRRTPRVPGRYRTTAWIPGNFLAEGTMVVGAAVSTMDPIEVHAHQRDAVAFEVVDSIDGDTARCDYACHIPGVVRPILEWQTTACLDEAAPESPLATIR